jgi:hypothetical protein
MTATGIYSCIRYSLWFSKPKSVLESVKNFFEGENGI